MAAISVRDLDEDVAARLKVRAALHGRSMEAEVRFIFTGAVLDTEDEGPNFAQALRTRFAAVDGVELLVPVRKDMPQAANLLHLQ